MATSPVIPKAKLAACERWDMSSFDGVARAANASAKNADQVAAQARAEAQARTAAQAQGRREGLEAGRREAFNENAARVTHLDQLISTLTADLARIDGELAHDVVELGLTVARKIIGEAIRTRPEAVLHAVEDALQHLGRVQGDITVIVHPEDAAVVREHLEATAGARTWSLKEAVTMGRGGCRIEAGGSEIDATVAQRWHRITAALGNPRDWLD
jgi:flagellar assembly protein FliH